MTKEEYNEAAALVVRLRKELEDATQDLSLHYDALKQSNAQCGEYLRQNEQLRADVATVAEELKRDISSLVHAASAERDKLHGELVEVRAALAATTEQRDSLKRTLDEWERADTKPHTRIDEVAQVVPVCMQCLKERIKTAHDYETGPSVAILTKPLLPDDVADHVVPPVLPMCMTCHHCGNALDASVFGPYNVCTTVGCPRTVTNNDDGSDKNPYDGPCHSGILVRHE